MPPLIAGKDEQAAPDPRQHGGGPDCQRVLEFPVRSASDGMLPMRLYGRDFSVRPFHFPGGAKGIRTPDPLHARQVRYHCAIAPGIRP